MTDRANSFVHGVSVAVLAAALLLPVGDAPWFSFWREWTTAIAVWLLLLGAANSLRAGSVRVQMSLGSVAGVAATLAALCWVQFAAGLIPYRSDALICSSYLSAFVLCVVVAASLPDGERDRIADSVAGAMLIAAWLSAPLAVLQWLGWATLDMGIPVAGGRPVAHMEQANLLCSLSIQGALGCWRLVERRVVGARFAPVLIAPLLLTIVLTQSRVAWVVGAALLVATAARHRTASRMASSRAVPVVIGSVVLVALSSLALPWVDAHLGLAGATLTERMAGGRRPGVWALFLDAATMRPWVGWGALQNGPAQYAAAEAHPSAAWFFSSAHNLVIDLLVWFGLPVGLLSGVALLVAVARRVWAAATPAGWVTALSAAALTLHALVEFPLHYLYNLLPLGLMLGCTTQRLPAPAARRWPPPSRGALLSLLVVPPLLLVTLAREYTQLSDVRPLLDIEPASRHPVLVAALPAPDVVLLDQLQSFHEFAAMPLHGGATASDLDRARTAMLRTPYAPAIERYALLAATQGRTDDAIAALRRICQFEPPVACEESARAWTFWQSQRPTLPAWQQVPLPR